MLSEQLLDSLDNEARRWWHDSSANWAPRKINRQHKMVAGMSVWPNLDDECIDRIEVVDYVSPTTFTSSHEAKAQADQPAEKPLTERQKRLREFWAKSDALIEAGMPVLTQEQINEEVSELRGNERGEG